MFNTISSVDPGSRLEGRVLPGDELRYINRHEIHDVLDYKYWAYDRSLTLEFRDAGTIRLRKKEGEDLGLNFETYLMDKPTGCSNRCIFCSLTSCRADCAKRSILKMTTRVFRSSRGIISRVRISPSVNCSASAI